MAVTNTIRKDDIGTILRLTINDDGSPVDVSSAVTTKNILLKKPSGSVVTKAASFTTDGTDGQIQYVTLISEIDEVGVWQAQAHVVITAGTFRSTIERFTVQDYLS